MNNDARNPFTGELRPIDMECGHGLAPPIVAPVRDRQEIPDPQVYEAPGDIDLGLLRPGSGDAYGVLPPRMFPEDTDRE